MGEKRLRQADAHIDINVRIDANAHINARAYINANAQTDTYIDADADTDKDDAGTVTLPGTGISLSAPTFGSTGRARSLSD